MSIPSLVISRSNEKLSDDSRLSNKQSAKLSLAERAIDAMMYEPLSGGSDKTMVTDKQKLNKFLEL